MEQPNKGNEGLKPADGELGDAPTSKSDAAYIDNIDVEVNTMGCKHTLAKKNGGYEGSDLLSFLSDNNQYTDQEKSKKKKASSKEKEEDKAPKSNASGDKSPAESNTKEAKRNHCKWARSKHDKKAVLSSKARRKEQNHI